MIIYLLDNKNIWTGDTKDIDPKGKFPFRFSIESPPELTEDQVAKWLFDKWVVMTSYPETPVNVEAEKTKLKAKINEIRYSKIYMESIPYTFPGDTEPDGIQMRDEVDRQNIQDFVVDAANKDPGTLMYWMPVSNNMKTLTAVQAVEMGQYLKARGDAIMAYSWQLKDQIERGIEVDIDIGWPE